MKTPRKRKASSCTDTMTSTVPAKRLRRTSEFGKFEHLVAQIDAPVSAEYRASIANFEDRPWQSIAAKEIVGKLLGDENNGTASLVAINNCGKTVVCKIAIDNFVGNAQKNDRTRGTTLVLYNKYKGVDKEQAKLIGAFSETAFSNKPAYLTAIKQQLDNVGFATTMIATRGLQNMNITGAIERE